MFFQKEFNMTAVAQKKKRFNLANEKTRLSLIHDYQGSVNVIEALPNFFDFLKFNESSDYLFGKSEFFKINDGYDGVVVILDNDNVVYQGVICRKLSRDVLKEAEKAGAIGVLLDKHKLIKKPKKKLFIVNADDPIGINDEFVGGYPFVSFGCIQQFYSEKYKVPTLLSSQRLKLLDYTPDEAIPLSDKEKATLRGGKRLIPAHGYTLLGEHWHRSGSCLFYDVKDKKTFLFGQDEGSYFGCELPKRVSTIEQAYDVLCPAEAKGTAYARQGEWFIIPIEEKDVPQYLDRLMTIDDLQTAYLAIESDESNIHNVTASKVVVGKDGKVYYEELSLTHNEHAQVLCRGWSVVARNTAVRSVSQEGVD